MKRVVDKRASKGFPSAVSDWMAEGGVVLASGEAPVRTRDASKGSTSIQSLARSRTDRPIKAHT
jgi:hypothetical protein